MRYEFKGMFLNLIAYFDNERGTYTAGPNGFDSFVTGETLDQLAHEYRRMWIEIKTLKGKEDQMKSTKTKTKKVVKAKAKTTKKRK